ncbi:protein fluG [Coniochaeta sp. 2T2.1]|nr:protein fluG [Coniochaeta sp. 2T2.1]
MLDRFLEKHGQVRFIRLHWVDYSGVMHTRLLSKAKAMRLQQDPSSTYKICVNALIIPISTSPACDASAAQVWEVLPDWESVRLCGFGYEHGGASLLIGFELEFVLLDDHNQVPQSVDRIEGFSTNAGLRVDNLVIVEKIFDAVEAADIQIHHLHTETTDQLEISLEPLEPMAAVEALLYTQECIRAIAIRHGRRATLAPRPFLARHPANGLHTHISGVFPNSATAAAAAASAGERFDRFIAGITGSLRAACLFGLANYDSDHRVRDDGAGRWVGWGTENRDFPLRKIGAAHWELRFADATANFYLFLSVVVGAGSAGLRNGDVLSPWRDCRVLNPSELGRDELASRYGITENLPFSLGEALGDARQDPNLAEWVGLDLLNKYFEIKEKEKRQSFSLPLLCLLYTIARSLLINYFQR